MFAFASGLRACMPSFLPPQISEISEPAALRVASGIKRVAVRTPLPGFEQPVGISIADFQPEDGTSERPPTVVLIHGFDSSLFEFRRLAPCLPQMRVVLVDLLGWGFTEKPGGVSYDVEAKRQCLAAVLDEILEADEQVFLGGASLGGAAAIDFASVYSERVRALILISPQAYLEGSPGEKLVWPLDRLGVSVLKSKPLRRLANTQSYFDTDQFATEEAMLIGRLPCLTDGWFDSNLRFMKSSGYRVKSTVAELQQDALILWGRQDKILSADNLERFQEDLGERLELEVIEECGHVPHLEKPQVCAERIGRFVAKFQGPRSQEPEAPTSVGARSSVGDP